MKNYQNHKPEIIEKARDYEDSKQYTVWVIGALPILSMFAISYFMYPAFQ